MTAGPLVENFFRHEYGKMVAVLTRQVGVDNLETVEDAVQTALGRALDTWSVNGQPDNPSGWLYRVARNELVSGFRQDSLRRRLLEEGWRPQVEDSSRTADALLSREIQDDQLRMLVVCCDDSIPESSRLVLALKTLCGFSIPEIAARLFTGESNVYQRLKRARDRLRDEQLDPGGLEPDDYAGRLPSVQRVLYLLFTEGYLANHAELTIRRELCHEAIRLSEVLANHPDGKTPATCALLALMYLHMARLSARQDGSGGLLLLEEQDRRQWDRDQIRQGLEWLSRSAAGDELTRYHVEAGIAAEHCMAPSFRETRWDLIAESYELIERAAPSAIHRLNRAIAVAEWRGPEDGLALLEGYEPPSWVAGSYMWSAVLADLHRRCGDLERARRYRDAALELAPNESVKVVLRRRLVARTTGA